MISLEGQAGLLPATVAHMNAVLSLDWYTLAQGATTTRQDGPSNIKRTPNEGTLPTPPPRIVPCSSRKAWHEHRRLRKPARSSAHEHMLAGLRAAFWSGCRRSATLGTAIMGTTLRIALQSLCCSTSSEFCSLPKNNEAQGV